MVLLCLLLRCEHFQVCWWYGSEDTFVDFGHTWFHLDSSSVFIVLTLELFFTNQAIVEQRFKLIIKLFSTLMAEFHFRFFSIQDNADRLLRIFNG
jgi:hypothetical protein